MGKSICAGGRIRIPTLSRLFEHDVFRLSRSCEETVHNRFAGERYCRKIVGGHVGVRQGVHSRQLHKGLDLPHRPTVRERVETADGIPRRFGIVVPAVGGNPRHQA